MGQNRILLSLCGVLVCNALGFGLGRVVCHGLLIASLGTPIHKAGNVDATDMRKAPSAVPGGTASTTS